MQVLGVKIPSAVAVMLPYVLTIVALTVTVNRGRQPAALNKPFERGGELGNRSRDPSRPSVSKLAGIALCLIVL